MIALTSHTLLHSSLCQERGRWITLHGDGEGIYGFTENFTSLVVAHASAQKSCLTVHLKDRAVAVVQRLLMIQKYHIHIVHSQGTMERLARYRKVVKRIETDSSFVKDLDLCSLLSPTDRVPPSASQQ